jgi:hypothetical protein
MPDELRFPELVRSLRSLGAARDATGELAHDAIFAPLMDARRRAARTTGREAIRLFRGAAIATAIETAVVSAASNGTRAPALGRARAAEARELIEPLCRALDALDAIPAGTSATEPTAAEWERWVSQLRRVFSAADVACVRLTTLLSTPTPDAAPTRWFGARGR